MRNLWYRLVNGWNRFMMGRRKMDELSRALLIGGAVGLVLSGLCSSGGLGFFSSLFSLLAIFLLLFAVVRIFSRDLSRRDSENYAYLNRVARAKNEAQAAKARRAQKDYRFFKCPGCGTWLRVPRGKGKIHINCRCGYTLYRKT